MNKKVIKIVILIIVCSLFIQNMASATELLCIQENTKITCTEQKEPTKGLFIAEIVEFVIVEVAKTVIAETVKELIIKEYKKRFGKTVAPNQITVVKK